MVQAHTIDLTPSVFNSFTNNNYIILEAIEGLEINDFILFRQPDAGTYRMTQVREIINDEGLKEGHVMLMVQKM